MLLLAAPPLRYRKECDSTGCHLGQPQPLYRPPRKEFFKEYSNLFQSKEEKFLSLTQALDILICMHGYEHICIAIDMPAKYHTQA